MPRHARLAILFSCIVHGLLIFATRYRLSYDAYIHMFFGDHYCMDWWSLWDARWYTGFFVTSYPPLVHQLMGALSHLVGIDTAFAVILWITVTVLPLAVYSFARVFVGKVSSGYAALGAAFLSSVYLTAHVFGQLPTLAATVTALFSMAALNRYLQDGDRLNGALTISLLSTVMAFHHATLLFLPWLVLAIIFHLIFKKRQNRQTLLLRLFIIGVFSALAMLIVIWPFWVWGHTQVMQTPIDHASRHNFFRDPFAFLLFFLPMYGPLTFIIPSALAIARQRQLFGLGLAFCGLFLLGLGGTTPLPRLFFGKGWEWLTYDRFAFWASLTLLPFFGIIVILLRRRRSSRIRTKVFLTLATTCLLIGFITIFVPLQPGSVDMGQIVGFLQQADRANWRYLTFGFGDQLALLSTLTTATTIDGSYHTARTLPELRTSGIAQIDTAFWLPNGLAALDPILQSAGKYGVRWGFVNVQKYVPVLEKNGWIKYRTLRSGVQVWENPTATLPKTTKSPPINWVASFSWGTLPILSLITSLSLASLRVWPVQAERILRGVYAFILGLIPLALSFWYYRTINEFPQHRVYFTYTDALFFLADGLALLAVIIWLAVKIRRGIHLSSIFYLPTTLCLLAILSTFWAKDWRTALYVSFHILLVFLFVLSLRDWREAWKPILLGCCAALSIEFITGIVEFVQQSTAFLAPLNLNWPGTLDSLTRGASIVGLPKGDAFLRIYGTLPHPNILGGFSFILLLAPVAFFMRKEEPNHLAPLLLLPGTSLLALTFSRSAWLALIVFSTVLIWKSRYFDRKRLVILLVILVLSFVITLLPYYRLVQARTINPTSHSEAFSFIGRGWLNGEAIKMVTEHLLTGVGIGSFIIELSRRAGEGYVIEPVHNVILLAAAELGIPGLLLVVALLISFFYRLFQTQNPEAILAGATLTGLCVISLFDHYLWTLAPGRLLLGLVIGLFVGQGTTYDS